jgi:hypothetical protein
MDELRFPYDIFTIVMGWNGEARDFSIKLLRDCTMYNSPHFEISTVL